MLKCFAKIFLCLFIILGFFAAFFSIAKTTNPQPANAAVCSLSFMTVGEPTVGKSITATIENTQSGGRYSMGLRRIGFGYVDTQTKVASGSSLIFTIDGSKITVAGNYQFESVRTDVVDDCTDPPVFTVGVGMTDCILNMKQAGGLVGEPVSFTLTDIEVGHEYIVSLVINGN